MKKSFLLLTTAILLSTSFVQAGGKETQEDLEFNDESLRSPLPRIHVDGEDMIPVVAKPLDADRLFPLPRRKPTNGFSFDGDENDNTTNQPVSADSTILDGDETDDIMVKPVEPLKWTLNPLLV
ncbi:MAG: hypothetical protein HYX35_04195 [Proteobacteria bacterium]|nr:hypothetical protein [Pseudomonadota bacterium]